MSDNLQIDFPPLWTPTAKEVAEIANGKAETIISAYQAGLLNVDTAQKELKKLAGETGMFDGITDEEIRSNAGKTFQDVTALRDPLMGLGYGGEKPALFDLVAHDQKQKIILPTSQGISMECGRKAAVVVK